MSKELKNITENVMVQIHDKNIKMKPRIYFIIGSLLTFAGLISSVVVSVFLFGLIRFSLRSHGPMSNYRLDQMLSSLPWWTPVFAVSSLILGILLIRRYDLFFKINSKIFITVFILSIIVGGWIIDIVGLNDVFLRHGPMQGVMRQHIQDADFPLGNRNGQGFNKKINE